MKKTESRSWAIVELMGHVRLAGILTEEERFGSKMGRIDIPVSDKKFVTQYFGGQSVYRITPVTEKIARLIATKSTHAPISHWDVPEEWIRKTLDAPPKKNSDDEECPF